MRWAVGGKNVLHGRRDFVHRRTCARATFSGAAAQILIPRPRPGAAPPALRAAVREAIENGYPEEIGVLIKQVAEHAPVVGRALGALAERFDYGALLDLLSDDG